MRSTYYVGFDRYIDSGRQDPDRPTYYIISGLAPWQTVSA